MMVRTVFLQSVEFLPMSSLCSTVSLLGHPTSSASQLLPEESNFIHRPPRTGLARIGPSAPPIGTSAPVAPFDWPTGGQFQTAP